MSTLENLQQGSSGKAVRISKENNADVTAVGSQHLGGVVVRTRNLHEQLVVAARMKAVVDGQTGVPL